MSSKISEQKSPEKIEFRVTEIKVVSYNRYDYQSFGYKLEDIVGGSVRIGVRFELEPDKEIFSILLKMEYIKDDNILFECESLHKIMIKDFINALKLTKTGQFEVDDEVMRLWLQISINDTRGMLIVLNSDSDYSGIVVPLVDLNTLINSLKGNVQMKVE